MKIRHYLIDWEAARLKIYLYLADLVKSGASQQTACDSFINLLILSLTWFYGAAKPKWFEIILLVIKYTMLHRSNNRKF